MAGSQGLRGGFRVVTAEVGGLDMKRGHQKNDHNKESFLRTPRNESNNTCRNLLGFIQVKKSGPNGKQGTSPEILCRD